MRDGDLQITELNGGFSVSVSGRANFDYAVPLRKLADKLTAGVWLQLDMENCETMDSTFMGVLTMLALKLRKNQSKVMVVNAGDNLVKLLRDLGVAKLFNFVTGEQQGAAAGNCVQFDKENSMLSTAQTVVEAHQTLVEADDANAARFNQVIEFAEQDVERLKNQEQ